MPSGGIANDKGMNNTHRISQLAIIIAQNTEIVNTFLTTNGSPTPSLAIDAPGSLPTGLAKDVEAARLEVIEATYELGALMSGPLELLKPRYTDMVSLKAIVRFNLVKLFPVGEEISYEDLSKLSGINEKGLRRLLRHGMVTYLFCEPRRGMVAHTALTQQLASDDMLHNNVLVALDEFWPAAVRVVDAIEKWPGSEEPNHTGFALANDTSKSMWEVYKDNLPRGERFGRAMTFMNSIKGYEPHYLLNNYPWETKSTVVDVGGSHGAVAISIAEKFPNVRCVVQDLPEVIEEGRLKFLPKLPDRVTFMAYNFFTEQPVVADVYHFRSIFHDWSDKYCLKILRSLVPALRHGARIVISDILIPDYVSMATTEAKGYRHMDIAMMQLFNAQERDALEWAGLFEKADARFKFLGAWQPPGAKQAIIEASWKGL